MDLYRFEKKLLTLLCNSDTGIQNNRQTNRAELSRIKRERVPLRIRTQIAGN